MLLTFSRGKFKLILKMSELVSQRKQNTFVVRSVTIEKSVEVIAREGRVEGQNGRLGRECVVFSRYRSKQCPD